MVLEREINNRFAGMRLDRYLTEIYTYHSRNVWQKKIDEGKVLLNGKPAKPASLIPRESRLSYDVGDVVEHPVNTDYRVLFDDAHLFMVDKPAGIPVHTSGKYFNKTLIKLLRADFPAYELNLSNRLDRETSGIIALAKTLLARKSLGAQFRNQSVKKTYIAYVFGEVKQDRFRVDAAIAEGGFGEVRIRMGVDEERGAPAATEFEVVRRGNGYTKLLCFPKTGRTNQIRVHLAHAGFPIVGDKLYSGRDEDFLEFVKNGNTPEMTARLILPRQALHAHKLTLTHPENGETMEFVSAEPDDLVVFEKEHMT